MLPMAGFIYRKVENHTPKHYIGYTFHRISWVFSHSSHLHQVSSRLGSLLFFNLHGDARSRHLSWLAPFLTNHLMPKRWKNHLDAAGIESGPPAQQATTLPITPCLSGRIDWVKLEKEWVWKGKKLDVPNVVLSIRTIGPVRVVELSPA